MILAACVLIFVSVGLLVTWAGLRPESAARRRFREEMLQKALSEARERGTVDDQVILRDEALSGFGPLHNLLRPLKVTSTLRRLLQQADLDVRVGTLMMAMLVLGGAGALAGSAARLGWTLSLVLGLLTGSIPYVYVVVCRKRRIRRFEEQFPEAVDLMSRAIRAGHAFSTGIKMVADEMPDPVGKEFRRVFEEQNLGLPLRNALVGLLDRVELVDLKLFVVAVLIQRQSGGNLSEILDKIAYTIRERFRILRQLRVHTAQARLTGIILTILPPVVGGIIYTINYEFMKVMFSEDWGIRVIVAAIVLQVLGFLWIRRIVNIEV